MSTEQMPRRARRPKGIIAIVTLFYIAAGLVVVAALATTERTLTEDMTVITTLYLLVMGWGLWRLYRWAWFSTLIMFVLSTFYVLSNGMLFNAAVGWPLLLIAVGSGYLLWPNVRRVYLSNGWEESP